MTYLTDIDPEFHSYIPDEMLGLSQASFQVQINDFVVWEDFPDETYGFGMMLPDGRLKMVALDLSAEEARKRLLTAVGAEAGKRLLTFSGVPAQA